MKSTSQKKYSYLILGLFLVIFLTMLIRLFSDLSFPNADTAVSRQEKAVLFPNAPVYQIFESNKNNLNQINIALNNTRENVGEKILVELGDENCQHILAWKKINYFSIFSRGYYAFTFNRFTDSKDKLYCLKLTNLANQKKKSEMPYITASDDPKFLGVSYVNSGKGGEIKNESLVFEPAYSEGSFSKDTEMLINRISQFKPWFMKEGYLMAVCAIFILATILLVVLMVLS